ncbi:hypothetical protein [Vibrio phage LP.1]|nr:hypothetical protein [Vibrio phage LP.1]
MPISARQFFNTKPRDIEYMTLELYHPAFGYKRYVANQYIEKTLGGLVYEPAAMIVTESISDETNSVNYEIELGRVGSQISQLAKQVKAYPFGYMRSVEATVRYFLSSDTTTPFRPVVTLEIGSLPMDSQNAKLILETSNPRGVKVARTYNGQDFPGLDVQI